MRNFKYLLAIILLCVLGSANAQNLIVGTFNLRFDNPKDSGNLWLNRLPVVASLIRFHQFDVLGTQEGLGNQINDLDKQLPEYQHYGLGRNDGKDAGEHSVIFFKREKFTLLNKGDFWLSQTPEKPSKGWDARLNRICSWVYLQDIKSKKKFYFFNVHYDHQGKIAREESSKLILERIKNIAGKGPVILTGDFNGDHTSSWYQRVANSDLLKDTYRLASHPYDYNPSANGFGRELQKSGVIDHIFITESLTVERWGILSDSYHGKFPSDHFPVLSEIRLNK
ncbi:MAG TPA: endonuclease/exonuclease/phosphatase family protein [Pedobacter sp.]|uniref:endonuclease/exonuclease/phosphatase family protein n=1 Tax=Pedobacter sp. TaxID=1411316 RepID=UPI002BADBE31|nr:endonuclease/exonuclease/phosphatase family protein [Pedobacter sp.]HMI04946.1 endonuclease/exonuclease/phosphatase family protein [Pedobacter sp.]